MPADWGKPLPPDAEWDDDALAGCQSWVAGWRQTHGSETNPPKDWQLVAEVGRDALRLMADEVPKVDLCRLMWAAGRDGATLGVRSA